jgi:hypothetical protein
MMRKAIWIAAISMGALIACHRAEPQATVQNDVAQARDAATEKVPTKRRQRRSPLQIRTSQRSRGRLTKRQPTPHTM